MRSQQRRIVGVGLGLSLALVVGIGLAGPALADAPALISYQGVLTLGNGTVVPDGSYGLEFSIYDAASGGTLVFTQQMDVAVKDGLYNVLLSDQGGYSLATAFSGFPRFMEVRVRTAPSSSNLSTPITLSPRQEIASVPYALNAPIPTPAPPTFKLWGATQTGALAFNTPSAPVSWMDIPGLDVPIDLTGPATLHVTASGVQRGTLAGTISCHQGYRILIDGVPVEPSDPIHGQRIFVSLRDTNYWAPWVVEHVTPVAVSEGHHDVRVQTNGSDPNGTGSSGCVVCGEIDGSTTPYTTCQLAVEAFSE